MKTIHKIPIVAAFFFSCVLLLYSCIMPAQTTVGVGVRYANPPWAAPYMAGVRYYYLPDIEVYFDLSDGEFVYLQNGQWIFSPVLPPIYSWYDLYDGFVIALDVNVYQPWQHHQFYVSHYPRYYYRNFYPRREVADIRGFNENDDRPVFWTDGERRRMTDIRRHPPHPVNPGIRRQPQETHYYGKHIGRPVRVTPQMRERGGRPRR